MYDIANVGTRVMMYTITFTVTLLDDKCRYYGDDVHYNIHSDAIRSQM